MKKILLTTSIILASINPVFSKEHDQNKGNGEAVVTESFENSKVYGNKWQADHKSLNINDAIKSHSYIVNKELIFTGNIAKVCQKRGCWMMLESEGAMARVDFNDHAFFIPKDSQGKGEVFGILQEKTVSQEMKEHMESEGAGKIAEKTYEIIATSVMVHH